MPSFIGTPAQIVWTGGEIELAPIRFNISPAVLSWSGGSPTMGPNLDAGLSVTKPRLDRLTRGQEYYDNKGRVGVQMQALWQKNVESVEDSFSALINQVAAIQAALDAATAAQDTATSAAQTAQTVQSDIELANSYTVPVNGNITASSDGTISIAPHSRYYSASNIVAVGAGSVTGLSEGVFYRVYYNDAAREGGTVAYRASAGDVIQSGTTHVVGAATIPLAGEPPSDGVGTTPPGYITDTDDFR